VVKELNAVLQALRKLGIEGAERGSESALESVARLLHRPVAEIRQVLALNERTASLDAPLEIDPDLSVGDTLADENSLPPDEAVGQAEVEQHLAAWVAGLPPRLRRVVEARYGLNGSEIETLQALAGELGVTRERVRQLQVEALQRLRQQLRLEGVQTGALL
jgi:RNA polymerase nonessential primary-like sigma factor